MTPPPPKRRSRHSSWSPSYRQRSLLLNVGSTSMRLRLEDGQVGGVARAASESSVHATRSLSRDDYVCLHSCERACNASGWTDRWMGGWMGGRRRRHRRDDVDGMGWETERGAVVGGWPAAARPSLVRSLPRSIGRSVACSAVSCLDRACSYSRLQCDKRRMRPSPPPFLRSSIAPLSPRSVVPAHERTRSKLSLLPPKSGVLPSYPLRCYRLRNAVTNYATLTRPRPPGGCHLTHASRTHSLSHSQCGRQSTLARRDGRGCYLHRTRWFWVRSGYRSARRSRGLGPTYVNR